MTKPPEPLTASLAPPPAVATNTAEQVAKSERATRLAKALRDNLRRRKAVRPERKDS